MDKLDKHDEQFEAYLRQFRLRTPSPLPEIASLNRRSSLRWLVAAAAGVVLIVALSSIFVRRSAVDGPRATVAEAGNPSLYKIGETIGAGRAIRSNSAAGLTLDLNDGSQIEMRAQSELQLEPAADGIRVHLNDGSILLTAAKQGSGHLYVQTRDVTVSVVGTVFLVSAEQSGTHVAVVEGEVDVRQGSNVKKLLPGEQMASAATFELKPIAEGIAWSRHASEYVAMLPQEASATPTAGVATQDGVTPEVPSSIQDLPFKVQVSYIKDTVESVRTLIVVQLRKRDLAFQDSKGQKVAHVDISGNLYRSDNRQLQPISASITVRDSSDGPVLYQQSRELRPGKYKLQLTVQDPQSKRTGDQSILVTVPRFAEQILQASSLILAYSGSELSPSTEAYPLGNYDVRPSATGEFRQDQSLNFWQEFYGLAVDSNTRKPSTTFELLISQEKRELIKFSSFGPRPEFFSSLSLTDFLPAQYDVQLKVTDNLAKQSLITTSKFTVVAGLSLQTQTPSPDRPVDAASGKEIFDRLCTTCHSAEVAMRRAGGLAQFSASDRELLAEKKAERERLRITLTDKNDRVITVLDQISKLESQENAALNQYSGFVLAHGKTFSSPVSTAQLSALVEYLFGEITKPAVTDLGRTIFLRACTSCHDENAPRYKPLASRDEYANLVSREMRFGISPALSSTEISVLIDYLFRTFGQPSDVPLQRPPKK